MIGRRLPVLYDEEGKPRLNMPIEPGDYCGPLRGYTGDLEACFFLKPNARDAGAPPVARSVQHVTFPPHTYRECADGSLEIRDSLGDMHVGWDEVAASDGWHGFLNEGHSWDLEKRP